MRLDDALKLAAALAVTDTDAYTTDSYDLGDTSPVRDLGAGEPMCLLVAVDVAAGGTTDTSDFIVVQSSNANLSSHDPLATYRIPKAKLTAGSLHILDIPALAISKRYIGGRVELGGGDTITVSVWLAPRKDVQQNDRSYASGFLMDNTA